MLLKSKPFAIITRRPRVQSISVSTSSITLLSIGATYKPTITFTPNTVADRNLVYKSENEAIAKVDEQGIITATGEGTTNIVFTTVDGSKTTKLKVTVAIPTVGLSINKSSHTFSGSNQTVQLIATLSSDTAKSAVTWSSTNTSVASVDNAGLVTSHSVGDCQITASTGELSARTNIIVEEPVMGLNLSTRKVTLAVGSSQTITATVVPSNATDKTLIWTSSNPDVATVSSNGTITGISDGTCRVEVTPNSNQNIRTYINVTVGVEATGIEVSHSNLTYTNVDEIRQVRATVLPEGASQTVTWTSSNENVAIVDSNGIVTSKGNGTCTITAKNNKGHTATISVTVNIAVTSISLNKSEITLTRVNESSTITATILPSSANQTVTWASSNPNVATVSSGVVTAKTNGMTTITATSNNGKTATALVYVNVPCESITLNRTSINSSTIGETFSLVATALPTAITNPVFTFTSTNTNVATVDRSGNVRIVGFGSCKIKVSYGGKEAVCNVEVNAIEVNGITLNAKSCTFTAINQTFKIQATVLPANATFKDLEYRIVSENAGFSVSSNGLVTCTGILGGTIEVVAHNGFKATFNVFTDTINIAIGDYNEKLGNLREAMQTANEKIAQQKTDVAVDNIGTEISNLSSKVNKEIDELDASLGHIRDNVLAGIEDGVLTDIEKARIESSLDSLKAEKADVDAQYIELYNNTYLVDTTTVRPKANLTLSYSSYLTTHNNVVAEIEGMLQMTQINSAHKNMYSIKLQNCINAYQVFKRHAAIAIDSIAQRKADLLYNDAKTYTDAKIKVESDRITSTVSSVTQLGNQVSNMQSTVTILAGEISSKVDVNGVSSIIQQNAESVRIAFNGISSGMTVTKYGLQLYTGGNIHTVLQNGRVEVMKKDGSSRLAYMGRNTWSGTSVEGCFLDAATGNTIGLGVNNVMGLCYAGTGFQATNNYINAGLNIFTHTYFHNRILYNVGTIYTSQVTIGTNFVEAPMLSATTQLKAQTIHSYDWCQAKRFITYTNATYQTRSGETKTVSVEKSCVDAITPNTEYVGTSKVVDGIATVELPPELYALGATYVVQITPIGNKNIFVAKKDVDSFVVEGDDCEFDYVIKVVLPNLPSREARCIDFEMIKDVDNTNGIHFEDVE